MILPSADAMGRGTARSMGRIFSPRLTAGAVHRIACQLHWLSQKLPLRANRLAGREVKMRIATICPALAAPLDDGRR